MVSARGLFKLIRPVNSVMMGIAILVGAAIGGGPLFLDSTIDLALAFLTGFFLSGSAMAVNDYYDRDIDAINEPARPIPSGDVAPGEALAVSLGLSAMGLLAAYLTSFNNLVLAALAWVAMMIYSTVGKKTGLPGNLIVSACIALPFVYGGVMAEGGDPGYSLLFALIAFLSNTGREVTKGIIDVEGDEALGIKTVAVSSGPRVAAWLSVAFYISAVIVSVAPVYLELVSLWYTPFVAFTDLGLLYLSFSLVREPSRVNSRRVKNRVLVLMLSGLMGFLAGSLIW
ncbi:MAG: geranylgeranylglycerol-phosphate geranylgeranyltransferase [Candidatus Bathyarchaeota archaeon]|jgi:geranylgeranylglycerol-phosphate geranylgeranyltransferase